MSGTNIRFYTVKEVAEKLKVKPNTVYQWLRRGKLKYWKIGGAIRISSNTLNKFGNSNTEDKPNPPCLSRMIG